MSRIFKDVLQHEGWILKKKCLKNSNLLRYLHLIRFDPKTRCDRYHNGTRSAKAILKLESN